MCILTELKRQTMSLMQCMQHASSEKDREKAEMLTEECADVQHCT